MKVDETSAQLIDELRQLREKVSELTARVHMLESGAPEEVSAPEEREGDFGPTIKRSAPVHHRSAVNKALTMLGVLPPQAETRQSDELTASHKHAIARMRGMGGDESAEEIEAVEVAEDVPAPAAAESDDAVPDIVPLPEMREAPRQTERAVEAQPVELQTALAIDLERMGSRVYELLRLLVETIALCVALTALPAHQGILAAVAFILVLATPRRPVLRAHARFLSLVVMARCLSPDVWATDTPLRLPAMIAACLPAFAAVFVGRVGWVVQAVGMGAVAAVIALSEGAAMVHAGSVGVVMLGLAVLWRRA